MKYNIVTLIGKQYPKRLKIDNWDTVIAASLIDISPYNYLYFEQKEVTIIDDSPSVFTVYKRPLKQSAFYYINSYIETFEDLKAKNNRKNDNIIETMETMGWNTIVRNINPKNKTAYQFRNVDKLIDLKGNIIHV